MYLVNSLHSGNNRFIFENNSLIIIKYRAKNRKSDRMIIRIRRAINYSGARERRWWRTREKGKERDRGRAECTTGLRREVGEGRGNGEERPPR